MVRAQVWTPPAETSATPLVSPVTSTGVARFVVVPSPSWARKLSPQHLRPPAGVTAHVWSRPAEMAATPLRARSRLQACCGPRSSRPQTHLRSCFPALDAARHGQSAGVAAPADTVAAAAAEAGCAAPWNTTRASNRASPSKPCQPHRYNVLEMCWTYRPCHRNFNPLLGADGFLLANLQGPVQLRTLWAGRKTLSSRCPGAGTRTDSLHSG